MDTSNTHRMLHRRVSLHYSNIEGGVDLVPLLEGQMDQLPPLSARVVRVFISSTFSDMIQERNALMEAVYPKLKDFCREKYRLEFQMIDLRWGLREESQDDHTIIEFCIKEIENCLKASVGPSFVALLGQKYGFRSFPKHISAEHFEMIRAELVRKGKDVTLLGMWFKKDTNVLPNIYSLQPISTILRDYTNKDSEELRERAVVEWERTFQELQHILRLGVMFCFEQNKLSQRDKDLYYISVTEYEIDQGMIRAAAPQSTSFCFTRSITNLKDFVHCKRAAKFIDIVKDNATGKPTVDVDAQQMLNVLRSDKIPASYGCSSELYRKVAGFPRPSDRLGNSSPSALIDKSDPSPCRDTEISPNLHHFNITWSDPDTCNPTENPEYLERFCEMFEKRMCGLIKSCVEKRLVSARSTQASEIHQHLMMCRARSELFRGREDVLSRVREYLSHPADYPLVLYGMSGSGKTSILAKSASLVRTWLRESVANSASSSSSSFASARGPSPAESSSSSSSALEACSYVSALNIVCNNRAGPPAVIVRFLGTTALCCSIRLVLGSICWHIASLRGSDTFSIPGDYPSLVNYFHDMLSHTTARQPLVLILDSLDQLSPAHRAHNLAWLPRTLPPHVHILLSTLPYEYDLLDTLQVLFPQRRNFIEVKSLGQELSIVLVREWLNGSGRDLTSHQYEVMTEALSHCSLPLYTRLVFEEVCRWSSYAPPDTMRLEYTVKGIINTLFDRLERYQGKIFVANTLAYLTASKNGLSNVEMEDVLSLDEFVLNDVFQHWLPPIRRIPPLLLPRLFDQLSSYIMQREANGAVVYYWYHHQFIFVARERYLSENHHKVYIHGMLAHYFLGTWGGGKGKPFRYSQKQLQLMSTRNKTVECKADRKVPLQPLQFGPDPVDPTIINYNLRKLSELPYHLLESRQFVDLKQEVLLNYSFLHAKLTALSLHEILSDFRTAIESGVTDPEVQLVYGALRVSGTYVNQNPDTLAFDLLGRLLVYYNDKMSIRSLLQQCDLKSPPHSALLPLYQCFESPRAMLLYVLEEHLQFVVDLVFTQHDLISVARDGMIMFWDLAMGECTMSIRVPGSDVAPPGVNTKLYVSNDSKFLVVDSDVINSPVYVYDLKTAQLLHQIGRRSPNQKRGFLVGHLMCRQKSIIDIRRGVEVGTIDEYVRSKRYLTCAITPDEQSLLIGEDLQTKMFNIEDSTLLATFPSENPPALFHVTDDSRRCYVGYTEDCLFKVLDINRTSRSLGEVLFIFNYKLGLASYASRLLEGSRYSREVAEIAVSPLKEDNVVLNVRRCNLVWLNVVTRDAKLLDIKPVLDGRAVKQNDINFFNVTFTFNGRHIVAGDDCYLHIWDMQTLHYVCTVQLHSAMRFPFSVSRTQNLVACGSSMHTAIKVWDLNKLDIKDAMDVKVYENPVDLISVVPSQRFAFVKKYFSLSSNKGYQYVDSFGIDVWNISTGTYSQFLTFSRYGKLLQMEISPDGAQMALLLSARDTYVSVFNMRVGKIICNIEVSMCYSITASVRWEYLVTCSHSNDVREIRLWNLMRQGEFIVLFSQAHSPVFSLDGNFLLYIDSGQTLISYSLSQMAPLRFMSLRADVLIPLPVSHRLVLTQTCSVERRPSLANDRQSPERSLDAPAEVSIWDFHDSRCVFSLRGVASSGIRDISMDGRLGVDGRLQVFDLSTGSLVTQLYPSGTMRRSNTSVPKTAQQLSDCVGVASGKSSGAGKSEWEWPGRGLEEEEEEFREWLFVRMTYDGQYVIYVDDVSIQVSSVISGRVVAHASTHERVTSLELMEYGYVLVLGREDGRLLIMKLIRETSSSRTQHHPDTLDSRVDFIMRGRDEIDESTVDSFDTLHRTPGQYIKDIDMPKASEAIRSALSSRAKVPHAVITTPKSNAHSHFITSSSSMTGLNTPLSLGPSSGSLGDLSRFARQNTSPLSTTTTPAPSTNDSDHDSGSASDAVDTGPAPSSNTLKKSSLVVDFSRQSRYPAGGARGSSGAQRGSTDDIVSSGATRYERRFSVERNPPSASSVPPSPTFVHQGESSGGRLREPPSLSGEGRSVSPGDLASNKHSYTTPVLTPFSPRLSPCTPLPPVFSPTSSTQDSPVTLKPPTGHGTASTSSDTSRNAGDDDSYTSPGTPHSPTYHESGGTSRVKKSVGNSDTPLSGTPALSSCPGYTHRSSSIPNIFSLSRHSGNQRKKGSSDNLSSSNRSASPAPSSASGSQSTVREGRPQSASTQRSSGASGGGFFRNLIPGKRKMNRKPPTGKSKSTDRDSRDESRERKPSV